MFSSPTGSLFDMGKKAVNTPVKDTKQPAARGRPKRKSGDGEEAAAPLAKRVKAEQLALVSPVGADQPEPALESKWELLVQ